MTEYLWMRSVGVYLCYWHDWSVVVFGLLMLAVLLECFLNRSAFELMCELICEMSNVKERKSKVESTTWVIMGSISTDETNRHGHN